MAADGGEIGEQEEVLDHDAQRGRWNPRTAQTSFELVPVLPPSDSARGGGGWVVGVRGWGGRWHPAAVAAAEREHVRRQILAGADRGPVLALDVTSVEVRRARQERAAELLHHPTSEALLAFFRNAAQFFLLPEEEQDDE